MAVVTLLRPPSVIGRWALTLNVTPPLSLAYVAGALAAAGHEPRIVDGVGEAVARIWAGYHPDVLVNGLTVAQLVERVDPRSGLIGISCMFSTEWPVVRELIAALGRRFPGVPIVCGGEHPTAAPEFSLEEAPALTACVLGEGEETAVALAVAVDEGSPWVGIAGLALRTVDGVVRTTPRPRIRAVDDIPLPRWDLTPIETYLAGGHSFGVDRGRTMPILASRGCPYSCTFCSSPAMWTTRWVARSPSLVADEIEGYVRALGAEAVDFYDLTAIVRRDWIIAFCNELLRRELPITWQLPSGTRSEAIDGEVATLLARSGCRNVSYAPESGSPRILRAIDKRVDLPRMEASMAAAVDAGLNVKANVMVGFPGEDLDHARETLDFIVRMALLGVHDVSVWTFSPYPGSRLFDELRAAGRLGPLDDAYFAALLSYSDLAGAVSWSEHMSSRTLRALRLFGMASFYAVSFARRPGRLAALVRNARSGHLESRLEMSVANLLRKVAPSAVARRPGRS